MIPADVADAIADARAELAAALVAGSPPDGWIVRTYAGSGPWAGMAALIAQGTPFLEPARDVPGPGAFRIRWGVLLVAGHFDVEASAAALDMMSATALAVAYGMPGWEAPSVGGARLLEVSGGRYLTGTLYASRVVSLC